MILRKKIPIRQFSTIKETYLLHACLSENRDAIIENLHKWKNEQDFDLIEKSTYRLIPLLEKQLRKFQIEDPNTPLYKGIYRKCWLKNKIMFHELVNICIHLQNNGIPVMVLKGAALSVLYYKDNGLRPMDDADIWVPFESLEQVLEILHKNGWYPRFNISKENILKYKRYVDHSADFQNDEQQYIDIHWKPVFLASSSKVDKEIWDHAQTILINGVALQTVNNEFQFFLVIVHGIKWNSLSSIRWIADSVTILKSTGDKFNWEELIDISKKYQAVLIVREAINYLISVFEAPVPIWVLEKIKTIPVSFTDQGEYRVITHHNQFYRGTYYKNILYYFKFKNVSEKLKPYSFIVGYIKYLYLLLEVDNFWELLYAIPRKIIKIIFRKISVTR